jgi:uncharacterized RDD family membrane protein YckC
MPYCSNCGAENTADQQYCRTCGTAKAASPTFAPMPTITESERGDTVALSGYLWRVAGYIIDLIILGIVVTFPLRALGVTSYAATFINIVIVFLYATLLLIYSNGQTLGMRVVRIRCVDERSRSRISNQQAIMRTALYCVLDVLGSLYHYTRYLHPDAHEKMLNSRHALLVIILFIPVVIDLFWPLWDRKNQTLHDKFAKTVVVRPVKL